MNRCLLVLTGLILLLTACGIQEEPISPTLVVSPNVPNTQTRTPSPTTTFPTPTTTPVFFTGILSAQVNVRSGPGVGYESLGLLASGQAVQVSKRSDDMRWYRIVYPGAEDGTGWVTAEYVTFPEGTPFFYTATSSPTTNLPIGRVIQRLNVRSGPGTSFESLGTLEIDTEVILTGKNSTASWFQIEFPLGTDDRAWITAQYIQTNSSSRLPVLDEYGVPLVTGTPGIISYHVSSTPTIGPAMEDGDSLLNPAARIIFVPGGLTHFIYSSQVSDPTGDGEDWVEFTPFTSQPGKDARIEFNLLCIGNGELKLELYQGGVTNTSWLPIGCNLYDQIRSIPAGIPYQLKLSIIPGDGLRMLHYFLSMENLP